MDKILIQEDQLEFIHSLDQKIEFVLGHDLAEGAEAVVPGLVISCQGRGSL